MYHRVSQIMMLPLVSLTSACRTEKLDTNKMYIYNKMETDEFKNYTKLWKEDFNKKKHQITINELRDDCETASEKVVAKFVTS